MLSHIIIGGVNASSILPSVHVSPYNKSGVFLLLAKSILKKYFSLFLLRYIVINESPNSTSLHMILSQFPPDTNMVVFLYFDESPQS